MNDITESILAKAGLWFLALATFSYVLQVFFPVYTRTEALSSGKTGLFQNGEWMRTLSSALLGASIVSLITSLVMRSMAAHFFALSNMYEALLVTTIGLLLAYFVTERWFRVPNLGWAVGLLGLVIMFYAGSIPTDINPLQAALRSYWRSIHVPPLLLSYGFFTLASLSSAAFLFTDRPDAHGGHSSGSSKGLGLLATREGAGGGVLSLSRSATADLYDEVTYRCIAAGFPLLMIGVILGAVWANEAWGNYWSWDPKESMSLVTLLGYGAYLHMRTNGEHSKRTLAYISLGGFLLVLMTFVGVNMWGFGSIHSYGAVK